MYIKFTFSSEKCRCLSSCPCQLSPSAPPNLAPPPETPCGAWCRRCKPIGAGMAQRNSLALWADQSGGLQSSLLGTPLHQQGCIGREGRTHSRKQRIPKPDPTQPPEGVSSLPPSQQLLARLQTPGVTPWPLAWFKLKIKNQSLNLSKKKYL